MRMYSIERSESHEWRMALALITFLLLFDQSRDAMHRSNIVKAIIWDIVAVFAMLMIARSSSAERIVNKILRTAFESVLLGLCVVGIQYTTNRYGMIALIGILFLYIILSYIIGVVRHKWW